MIEIWKKIENYDDFKIDGLYEVSSLGRIKSLPRRSTIKNERILTPATMKGYLLVTLKNVKSKSALVHRLVAMAFISNPLNKSCVNHKNGNKTDNKVKNLEWVTYSENMQHAFKIGLCDVRGENHNRTKLKNIDVIFIRKSKLKRTYLSILFNVSVRTICSIKNRTTWNYKIC